MAKQSAGGGKGESSNKGPKRAASKPSFKKLVEADLTKHVKADKPSSPPPKPPKESEGGTEDLGARRQ